MKSYKLWSVFITLLLFSTVTQVQAATGACTQHQLDWSTYPDLNGVGNTVYPFIETAADIDGSGIDLTVTMPREGRDHKHVDSNSTTFPVVATYMNGNPEVYRYWGQDDISPADALTYNFSEDITINQFMFGGHRPPSGKFGYGVMTFWDGPNGTGSKVTSLHANGADSSTTLATMTSPTTDAINVLPFTSSGNPANYPSSFLTTTDDYAMVTYDANAASGQRTFTVLDMGGATVRSMTWKMYTSDVDVSPKDTDSKDLAIAEAGIRKNVNMSGYIGNFELEKCPEMVKIGNLVWIEDDNDGDSTTGNITPVVGSTVTATASDGTTTYTGITDASGNYLIDVPANDTYTVTVATPAGVVPTAGSTDSDVGTDTSGENNKTHNGAGTTVTVETTDNLTLDFGFTPPTTPLVKIGNLVWIEDDNDGDSTTGNITPVVGSTVTATASDGTTTYTGITDASGNYLIDVPANDTYTVTVATPAGVVPTAGSTDSDVGTDTSGENNKTHNGAGTTVTVETTDNLTLDFGFTPPAPLVKIGNLLWIEDDNDGDSTTGNITPVVGSTVTATASDGTTTYTGITDASGNYLIDVPANDTYTVTVATPAGVVPTAGSTDSDVGTDTSGENNKTHNGAGTTVTVETTDNLTLDFGFVPSVKIGSLIWYEDDNDGDATTGTVTYPPAGVVVTARAADGSIYTGITGANGSYSIDVPINGTYTVTIPPPTGFSPTAGSGDNGVPSDNSEDNKSHNGSGTTVTVGTTDNLTVDFGFINNSLLPPPSNEPIPTLSEWALLLLMMILGLIGYRQGLVRKS